MPDTTNRTDPFPLKGFAVAGALTLVIMGSISYVKRQNAKAEQAHLLQSVEVVAYHKYTPLGRDPVEWPIFVTADKTATVVRIGSLGSQPEAATREQALGYSGSLMRELSSWAQREGVKILSVAVEETFTEQSRYHSYDSKIPLMFQLTVDRGKN